MFFFDFDGVVLNSVHVKETAFGKLFSQYGDGVVQKVRAYHVSHGGVTRFEKFRYYCETLIGIQYTKEIEKKLDMDFSDIVMQNILRAEFIPGVQEFLFWAKDKKISVHLASAAPKEELLAICKKRNLSGFFKSINGGPEKKEDIIARILLEEKKKPLQCMMFGDTSSDHDAACQNGIRFIAINPLDKQFFIENNIEYYAAFDEMDWSVFERWLDRESVA